MKQPINNVFKRENTKYLKYFAACIIGLFFCFPYLLLIRNSLISQNAFTSIHQSPLPLSQIHLTNFVKIFTDPSIPILHSLLISIIIALVQTVIVTLISAFAGYAFSRSKSAFTKILWRLTIGTLLFPTAVTFLPSYLIISEFGWIGSLKALIIPGLFQALTVLIFRQFFLNFPVEIEHAARIDGLNAWKIFWKIIAPNSIPVTASITTLVFINSWNAFLWPFIASNNPQTWTIQVSLSAFLTSQSANYPELFATSLVSIIPAAIVFICLSKFMIKGYTYAYDTV